jgi:hypothetical protein
MPRNSGDNLQDESRLRISLAPSQSDILIAVDDTPGPMPTICSDRLQASECRELLLPVQTCALSHDAKMELPL